MTPYPLEGANIRIEDELLLCCARTAICGQVANRLKILLSKDIDWRYLIKIAAHHRVIPLLYRSLSKSCLEIPPTKILHELKRVCEAITQRNLFLLAELIKLIGMLEEQKICAIPYKGPVIALTAYNNVGLRQFGDLDIWVHEQEYFSARSLLSASGYRLTNDWGWECTLVDDIRGVYVDLHRALAPEIFAINLDFHRVVERLVPLPIAGGRVRTFCAEDSLLVLCVQLVKDAWGNSPLRLSKVCDIAELIRAHPNIDWDLVGKEAKRVGCRRVVLLGATVAQELLSASAPELVCGIRGRANLDALGAQIKYKLFYEAEGSYPQPLSKQRFFFKVRERWRDKIYPQYQSLRQRVVPNERDRALLRLPSALYFIYYFLRPVRLARNGGWRLCRWVRARWLRDRDRR